MSTALGPVKFCCVEYDDDTRFLFSWNITRGSRFPGSVDKFHWSVAGKKKGFDDPRGKLWEDTIRVVKKNKPI